MNSPYAMRNDIFAALNKIYGTDGKTEYPYFSKSLVAATTDSLCLQIAFAYMDFKFDSSVRAAYYLDNLESKIVHTIWINFPGGSTAEYARDEVMKAIKEGFR